MLARLCSVNVLSLVKNDVEIRHRFFYGKPKESIFRKHLCLDVGKKEDKICHSPMIDKAK